MSDDLEVRQTPADSTARATAPLLAPLWHTALIVALVAATSLAGARSARRMPSGQHSNLASYGATIALEWSLAGIVLWGLRVKRTPLSAILGESKPGVRAWCADAVAAFVFWIAALLVLGSLAALMKPLHLPVDGLRNIVSRLAPGTPLELLVWTLLCLSAGICEEFVFRGYLQQQFTCLTRRVWAGVFASAAVFGFAHGYEGWSGMLLIVAFGALFSVLRLVRGNVRAGIMAHAWHDFFSGMVLYAIAHSKLLK